MPPVDGNISTAKSSFFACRQGLDRLGRLARYDVEVDLEHLERRGAPLVLGEVEHLVDEEAQPLDRLRGSPRHSRAHPCSACRHSLSDSISAKPLIEVIGVRSS